MKLAATLLSVRLMARQLGWRLPLSALLLAGALLVQREYLPAWARAIEAQSRQAALLSKPQAKPSMTAQVGITPAQAQAELKAVLGNPDTLDAALQTLFTTAARQTLKLPQARYTALPDRDGLYQRHRVELSMSGSYAHIRFFLLDVLRSLPYASLERLRLTRRAIDTDTLDSTATLIFYLQPHTISEDTRRPRAGA